MGNRQSRRVPPAVAQLFASCCKCRTYSVDAGAGNTAGGAAAELRERQPVAPGASEPVGNEPANEHPPVAAEDSAVAAAAAVDAASTAFESLPEPEALSAGMFLRLPKPPRNPTGESIFIFFYLVYLSTLF